MSEPIPPQVNLCGDAHITFTAPFYADGDPLEPRPECFVPEGDDLDGGGALTATPISISPLLQGSLTYVQPALSLLATFVGSEEWTRRLRSTLAEALPEAAGAALERIEVIGLLFPDGYGAIAVTLHLTSGWDPGRREEVLSGLGASGREEFAAVLRNELLPPVRGTLSRCGAGERAALPYFNLTYAGSTDHPEAGRSALDDKLRDLVYPNTSQPLVSGSPWRDEYLYAGYAYSVLAKPDPQANADKFRLLLLIVGVSYVRLARTAAAADAALRRHRLADAGWLTALEHRLRAEYQALVTPTFSYDHHALRARDALLESWQAGHLQTRTETLLSTMRRTIEQWLAEAQARRVRRLNLVVVVLTVLAAVATFDAGVSLYDRFFT